MVTHQILVLTFLVRAQVAQQTISFLMKKTAKNAILAGFLCFDKCHPKKVDANSVTNSVTLLENLLLFFSDCYLYECYNAMKPSLAIDILVKKSSYKLKG